jgi:translation initiation factor 2 subunit 2
MEDLPLIDFSKVRKKRPLNQRNDNTTGGDDLSDIIIKKTSKKLTTDGMEDNTQDQKTTSTFGLGGNQEYSYDFLLDRISNLIKKNNPSFGDSKKVSIPVPQMNKVGTTRTAWVNFSEVCNSLNRPTDHMYNFILSELGVEGSLGGESQFLMRGKFNNKHIESLLKKYVHDYVQCSNCKSSTTVLKKDNTSRLQVMACSSCGSEKTVQPLKVGVQKATKK